MPSLLFFQSAPRRERRDQPGSLRPRARASRPTPVAAMIAGVFLTLATGACGPAETATDDDVVRVVVLPYLSMAPLHIAAEEGYFEARGLQVEFIRLNSVRDFLPMLITGQVDAAAGMMNVAMFNAMGEGGRLRAVAAVSELIPGDCPFTAFVTRRELRDSGVLESGEGVRGLRFDADPLLPEAYWIEAHLRTLGASVDDVEIIDLPEPNGAQLLLEGATDVASLGEPFLGMTTADPELVVWRSAADIVAGFPISVLYFGTTLLDERPGVGERFAAALLDGIRQFRRGKTERNLELVESFTGLPAQRVASACWPGGRESAHIDAVKIREYQEWALQRGLIDRVLDENEWLDHRFVDPSVP